MRGYSNFFLTVAVGFISLGGPFLGEASTTPSNSAFSAMMATHFSEKFPSGVDGPQVNSAPHSNSVGKLKGYSWLKYSSVNFGKGAKSFTILMAVLNSYAGQSIELHLDSQEGRQIGNLLTVGTSKTKWFNFLPQTINLSETVTGVHDFYLVFTKVGSFGYGNIQSFRFGSLAHPLSSGASGGGVSVSGSADLSSVLQNAMPNTVYNLAPHTTYTLQRGVSFPANVPGVALRGGSETKIHYTGRGGAIFSFASPDTELSNLYIYGDYANPADSTSVVVLIYGTSQRDLIQGITIDKLDGIATMQDFRVTDLSVINCQALAPISGDFVFFTGQRLLVDSCSAINSRYQHIIRVNESNHDGTPTDITIRNSHFENNGQEVIAIRDAHRVLIQNNTLIGWDRIGEGGGITLNASCPAVPSACPASEITYKQNTIEDVPHNGNTGYVTANPFVGGIILFEANVFLHPDNGISADGPNHLIFRNNRFPNDPSNSLTQVHVFNDRADSRLVIEGLAKSMILNANNATVRENVTSSNPQLPTLPELPRVPY